MVEMHGVMLFWGQEYHGMHPFRGFMVSMCPVCLITGDVDLDHLVIALWLHFSTVKLLSFPL